MSLEDYKTTINGSVVKFNEIFSSASANTNNSDVSEFKTNGTNPDLTGDSFSNDGDHILADGYFGVRGFDGTNPISSTNPNIKSLEWGYNDGSKIGTHWGFNDKQKNVGYKTDGVDIGPRCCAKFVDYTADSDNIPVPPWVDYFNVLAVGEGGDKGGGRTTDDWSDGCRAQGPTGSSGGFIAWKSQTNLGNVYGFYYKVVFGSGSAEFQLYSPNAKVGWCKADKGITGNTITGNDDDDVHVTTCRSAGYADAQNYLTSSSGGTAYGERFITGRPCTSLYDVTNTSDNLIAQTVYGWSDSEYGRGQSWQASNGTSAAPGKAAVRVYYIGYPIDVS